MYVRSIAVGILSAIALNLPAHQAPRFSLDTTGAVRLDAAGHEARYGIIAADGTPFLSVSLGAAGPGSALLLTLPGGQVPAEGSYPIRSIMGGTAFHAAFAAGSPEHPLGWFQGQSGTVTITRAADGQLAGRFEIQARGFLSAHPADEDCWVTLTGSFEAEGDSSTTTIAAVQ